MAAKKKKNRGWLYFIRASIIALIALAGFALYEWAFFSWGKFERYPDFGIKLPVDFTIHGIDVSKYQQMIDWDKVQQMKVRNVTLRFAFIKATEGLSRKDPFFNRNWKKARQAGVIAGAYHFFIPGKSGKAQAEHFIRQVELQSGDLPPVIDIEQTYGVPAELLQKRVKEFMECLERNYKIKPIIYTNVEFYRKYLDESFDQYPLWVAHYLQRGRPRIFRSWSFWQHSETGHVNGIRHQVDFNVFNGDEKAFQEMRIP